MDALFLSRGNLYDLNDEEFDREYVLRYSAMEEAMRRLDQEGLFAVNQRREDVVVLVEVMPPDETNTQRAYRLNRPDCGMLHIWLEEAAE